MDEFIDPKAAVTPFVAGVTVTFITNSIWYAFGFPPIFTALFLSVLFGLLIVRKHKVSFFFKSIYFILNTLIVFSLAYSNALMVKNMTSMREEMTYYNPSVSVTTTQQRDYFVDWFNLRGSSND